MYRHLKRGLFIMVVWGLPMVCLLLAGRSLVRVDIVSRTTPMSYMILDSGHGQLLLMRMTDQRYLQYMNDPDAGPDAPPRWVYSRQPVDPQQRRVFGWIQYDHHDGTRRIIIPWWMITAIALIIAVLVYRPVRRRRRRRKLGLCTRCGYDLRGQSDDSTGCPECGTAAA